MASKKSETNSFHDPLEQNKHVRKSPTTTKPDKSRQKKLLSPSSSSKWCISTWSLWYGLLIVSIHVYLIKTQIDRIISIQKRYNDSAAFSPTHAAEWSHNATVVYLNIFDALSVRDQLFYETVSRICWLSLSIACLILFLVASLKQTGNYPNDGVKFGRDFFLENLHRRRPSLTPRASKLKEKVQTTPCTDSVPTVQLAVTESSSLSDDTSSSFISSTSDGSHSKNVTSRCVCLKRLFAAVLRSLRTLWRHFLPFNSFFHLLSILFLILPELVHQR